MRVSEAGEKGKGRGVRALLSFFLSFFRTVNNPRSNRSRCFASHHGCASLAASAATSASFSAFLLPVCNQNVAAVTSLSSLSSSPEVMRLLPLLLWSLLRERLNPSRRTPIHRCRSCSEGGSRLRREFRIRRRAEYYYRGATQHRGRVK